MKIISIPTRNFPSNESLKAKENVNKKDNQSAKMMPDKYTPSQVHAVRGNYDKPNPKVDHKTIEKLKDESERTYSNLREMVRQLLQRQGMTSKDIENPEAVVKVDEKTRIEAQAAIAEGGPLSPTAVSDRIVEFANAISGGDKGKYEVLKSAIEEGFEKAKKMLGGELPEISQETYDMVMDKLEAWSNEE